jgi:hypothetical protein
MENIFYFDEYAITADENQFVLKKRKTVKDSHKAENIGKEYYENIGYFGTIQSVYQTLANRLCMDNIGKLSIAIKKIDKLTGMLKNLTTLKDE